MANVLRVKGENGAWIDVPALVGPKGDPGPAPVRGVDYWTEEDKTEVVEEVLAQLLNGDEVSY